MVDLATLHLSDFLEHLARESYSTADERRILDALGRGLLKEFPNPPAYRVPGRRRSQENRLARDAALGRREVARPPRLLQPML